MTKLTLTVNGQPVEVPAGSTVLQACELAGVEIPRFCYHDKLSIAGNCRMCLVEVSPGPPKPQASCALPAVEGMRVLTHSTQTRDARRTAMEFLLINHPLDCPICDQGGECDLQDQAMAYGSGFSRYDFGKRSVAEAAMGPLIKTTLTRCIHCTRCVRFSTEVGGVSELGLVGRGENAVITSLGQAISSELSGNVIDLCPVGALTAKPYAFRARSWELTSTPAIDPFDGVGSNITLQTRGNAVMRVLPRINEDVNSEWIGDKVRFAFDGLTIQRLDRPWLRPSPADPLEEASWDRVLDRFCERIQRFGSEGLAIVVGDHYDAETLYSIKSLANRLRVPHLESRADGCALIGGDARHRQLYLFNSTFNALDDADVVILIGCELRREAPVLSARLRLNVTAPGSNTQVFRIGAETNDHYFEQRLGDNLNALDHKNLHRALAHCAKPMVIVGAAVAAQPLGNHLLNTILEFCHRHQIFRPDWIDYDLLHHASSRVAALDLGLTPDDPYQTASDLVAILQPSSKTASPIHSLWLIGADDFASQLQREALIKAGIEVFYQGHHGDRGAHLADAILAGATAFERDGTWVNSEGRVQTGVLGTLPPGQARQDWKIIRELSGRLNQTLPWDSWPALQKNLLVYRPDYKAGAQVTMRPMQDPTLRYQTRGSLANGATANGAGAHGAASAATASAVGELALPYLIDNYYMTDPISRASPTMAACVKEILGW